MKPLPWARWLAVVLTVALGALFFGVSPSRGAPNIMWVAVMEDSTDACVTKTADRFGDVLTVVKFNQQVEVTRDLWEDDKDNPRPYYRVKIENLTGYIKRNALATKSQYQGEKGDSEAKVAVGAAAANTAAKGLNSQNEATLRKSDANFDKAVSEVDALERAVNQLVYEAERPDPRKGIEGYRKWADEGQNTPAEPPKSSGKDD